MKIMIRQFDLSVPSNAFDYNWARTVKWSMQVPGAAMAYGGLFTNVWRKPYKEALDRLLQIAPEPLIILMWSWSAGVQGS